MVYAQAPQAKCCRAMFRRANAYIRMTRRHAPGALEGSLDTIVRLSHIYECSLLGGKPSDCAQVATFKRLLEAAELQTESSETLFVRCLQRCRDAGIAHLDSEQRKALRKSLAGQDRWWQQKSDMAEMLAMLPLFETTDGGWVALYGPVGCQRGPTLAV